MNRNFDQTRIELDHALSLRLVDAAGSTVVCLEGFLWVTRDGCKKDVQLAPGEGYRLEDAMPVIVTGFGPSVARVLEPAARRRVRAPRWLSWLTPRRSSALSTA